MTHEEIELLSAHLDGETTEAERRRIDLHLAACPQCAARSAALAAASRAVASLPEVAPTPDESRAIRLGVGDRAGPRPLWRSPRLLGTLSAAAVAALAFAGISTLRSRPEGTGALQEAAAPPVAAEIRDFENAEEVREAVADDPQVIAGVDRYTVADVGTRQAAALEALGRSEPAPTETAAADEQAPAAALGGAGERSAGDCLGEVLRSQPYPMMPLVARPSGFKGAPAWLLVYAFTNEQGNEKARLDRVQVWLVTRTGCSPLHFSRFKP